MICYHCDEESPLTWWRPVIQPCPSDSCSEIWGRECPKCHESVAHTWLDGQQEWTKSIWYHRVGGRASHTIDLYTAATIESEAWEQAVDWHIRNLGTLSRNEWSDAEVSLYQLSASIHKRIGHLNIALEEGKEFKDNYW